MNKKHVGNRASNYIRSKGRIGAVQGAAKWVKKLNLKSK